MSQLIILRHANTFDPGDQIRRVGARTDMPLSVSGKRQANAIAAHFFSQRIQFSIIYAAPLKRAMMTAAAVTCAAGRPSAIEPLDLLTEIDYGPDENKPEDEVRARIGKVALAAWEKDAIAPPGWRVDRSALVEGWRGFFKQCAGAPGPVLAVTSNGVARFALDAAQTESNAVHARKLKTAAYGVVEIGRKGAATVRAWNLRASE